MSGHWSNRIFRTHLPISNVCFRLGAAGQIIELRQAENDPKLTFGFAAGCEMIKHISFDKAQDTLDQDKLDEMAETRLGLTRSTETTAAVCRQIGEGPPCIHFEL